MSKRTKLNSQTDRNATTSPTVSPIAGPQSYEDIRPMLPKAAQQIADSAIRVAGPGRAEDLRQEMASHFYERIKEDGSDQDLTRDASGFRRAALRSRLTDCADLCADRCWKPVDWVLVSDRRSAIAVGVATAGVAVMLGLHSGPYGIVTSLSSIGLVGGWGSQVIRRLRAYRGVYPPERQRS